MKKFMSLALCLLLLLGITACSTPTEPQPPSNSMTTISLRPEDSAPEPTEPELPEIDPAFLTGLEKGADYPQDKRVVGIMVNNIAESRPARGLSEAELLFEIQVEGPITRFMAVYPDYEAIPQVGPVRSGRDQHFQLLLPFQGFYVHIGESVVQTEFKNRNEYADFDINAGSAVWWAERPGYDKEHRAYTNAEKLTKNIEDNNRDAYRHYGSTFFLFNRYDQPNRELTEGSSQEVGVVFSGSYRSIFKYNDATGRYDMNMYNSNRGTVEATIDENNGEQVAFDNVVVLFAPMERYPNSVLNKVHYDSGIGYYFCNGQFETIRWQKGGETQPLRLYVNDTTETMLVVNPGTSYVAIVDDKQLEDFYYSVQAGTGASVAADGEQGTDEAQYDD